MLSISYAPTGDGGCDVDVWCSAGVKNYGLLNHAQLVWRKKRAVIQALAQAQSDHSLAPAQSAPVQAAQVAPVRGVPTEGRASAIADMSSDELQSRDQPSRINYVKQPKSASRIESPEGRQNSTPSNRPKAANGSKMIMAWLDELARIQPQYGALLRSTAEQVGPLPAISDDGNVYSISHTRFAYGAGFASAYASRAAEHRYIQAVLAGEDARKSQDELAMVNKDAEGRFWSDVKGWIESEGVAKMRPSSIPEWLAGFHPNYLP